MRSRYRLAAVLVLAITLLCLTQGTDAAKKKKAKAKKAKTAGGDPLRCGVCVVAIEEIFKELATTENSTSTLDLRWGLTAEVTDGRAKRIGKVIKYNRSELRAIEVMEKICGELSKYERYEEVKGEVQLKTRAQIRELFPDIDKESKSDEQKERTKADKSKFERFCEELTENSETAITRSIKEELSFDAFVDAVCYGDTDNPCGLTRNKCAPGTFSNVTGMSPCSVCAHGFFQTDEGQTLCNACPDGTNTTGRGTSSASKCITMCQPGHFSANGLDAPDPCSQCGAGAYQPKRGMQACDSCPDGKNTAAAGAVYVNECVAICGDSRRAIDELCDDGNKYPGDGCDHECKVEAGARCSSNNVGSSSVCNKVICGDSKTQIADDGSAREACDDGNTESDDGCSATCQVESGWKCSEKEGKSVCKEVKCGDALMQRSQDDTRNEACDDGNTESGDGCSATCELEPAFICSTRREATSTCVKPTCGDGFREAVQGAAEECDDGNTASADGCSSSCTVEDGWKCDQLAGSPKRADANGQGEWTSLGKDNCTDTRTPEEKDKAGSKGGWFDGMFGGKKKDEV